MTPDGTAAPVLTTARLRLRRYRPDDLAARMALAATPGVMRLSGGVAATEEESWHRLLRYIGHWHAFGHGMFVVEARGTGRYLGEVGAMDFRRGIAGFGDVPETAWAFMPDAHGTGVAGEAMRALACWLDADAGRRGTVCIIGADNAASRRLAARTGYVATGATTWRGVSVDMFARAAGATFATAPG